MGGGEDGCMEQAGGTVSNSLVTALSVPWKCGLAYEWILCSDRKKGRKDPCYNLEAP